LRRVLDLLDYHPTMAIKLEVSSLRRTFLGWAAAGAIFALLLIWTQAMAVGGLTGLLQVGENSELRPVIEGQLGSLALAPDYGHDGQIFYAVALDLRGELVPDLLDHAGFRYRRILFPLLSSGFGLLDGYALLYGMIAVVILSAGLATGATAWIAARRGLSELAALAVLLNPGVWLSVRLLTADILGLALMLAGLAAVLSSVRRSAIWLALATAAKDTFLTTPAGLSLGRDWRRWVLFALSAATLVAVMLWTSFVVGDGFALRGNLSLPISGILQASPNWSSLKGGDLFYLVFALVSTFAGLIIGVLHKSWLRWPILGWSGLAILSSSWIWDYGNNAARAFAPIVVLLALSLAEPLRTGPATGRHQGKGRTPPSAG
jgi:hypothetical protein